MVMGLNFGLQRLPANTVTAPKTNINYDSILGLTPTQYTGLQQVSGTPYYYGNNRMYEPYTITSSLAQNSDPLKGPWSYVKLPTGETVVSNYHPKHGGSSPYVSNRAEGTIEIGNQAFRPISSDITGFSKSKVGDTEMYEYSPSMAYIYSQMRPQITTQPNVMAVNAPGYQQATGPMLSSPMTTGSGAGRFLNTGNLLGFNFTPAQTSTTTSNP